MTNMTHQNHIEEIVNEFEQKYVNTQLNIDGGLAYKEWAYKQDAEEAIDWLRTTLTAHGDQQAEEARKATLLDFAMFAHSRYLGTDGKEYAYSQEVVYMVDEYLELTPPNTTEL